MKKIKYIDLVFENCEVARLKPNEFRGLVVSEITKEYLINCYQYKDGKICEYIKCKYFEITINKKGLKSKPFKYSKKLNLGERITRHNDITHIDIFLKDGKNEYITVPWESAVDSEYDNKKQKTLKSKHEEGDLYIKIE